jgi:hypothetical protein
MGLALLLLDVFSVSVVAEGFQRQWQQERFFFNEHRFDLAFGRAMDAGVGPLLFPPIEISLRIPLIGVLLVWPTPDSRSRSRSWIRQGRATTP